MSGRSRQKIESLKWVRRKKWARHWERASSGGRVEREAPCHSMWQRSGVATGDRKVRRMREHASLGARRERDVTEPSRSFQKVGPGGTNSAVKLLTQETETSLILRRPTATKVTPRALASNKGVVARINPPERLPGAWTRHGGVTMRVKESTVKEDLRDGVEESRTGVGMNRGPSRTGATLRDCDGKRQPQLTSHAHGQGEEVG